MSNELLISALPWEEYDLDENFSQLKIMIYGESGLGKSVLAGSICAVDGGCPTLGLDVEGGMTSLAAFGYKGQDRIRFLKVKNFSEGEKAYTVAKDFLIANKGAFKSVLIDSLTSLQAKMIKEICVKQGKENPDLKVWNRASALMTEELEGIKDLGLHVVITALAKEVRDEASGKLSIMPFLKGSASKDVPAQLDIVGYYSMQKCEDGVTRRVIQFESDGIFMAKDRTGALPKYMIDPTMGKIMQLIREKHNLVA